LSKNKKEKIRKKNKNERGRENGEFWVFQKGQNRVMVTWEVCKPRGFLNIKEGKERKARTNSKK